MKLQTTFFLAISLLSQPLFSQWNNIKPAGSQNISDVEILGDFSAVLLSGDSVQQLFHTTDGGQSWSANALPIWTNPDPMYWQGIVFVNSQQGFIHGNWLVNGGVFANGTESFTMFRTNDGGQTWQNLTPAPPAVGLENISSIHFFNPNQGFVTLTTGLGYDLIKSTDDGGQSWQTRDTLRNWGNQMHLNPDGTGYVLRYKHDFHLNTNSYFLYRVEDFGKNWTEIPDPTNDPLWPEYIVGMWYEEDLRGENNVSIQLRTDLQDLGYQDDITYLDLSIESNGFWIMAFLKLTGEYINEARIEDNSIWVQTWENLYRTDLHFVEVKSPQPMELGVGPNPAVAGEAIELSLSELLTETKGIGRLLSSDGKLIQSFDLQFVAGKTQIQLPNTPAGIYWLELRTQGKVVIEKIEIH